MTNSENERDKIEEYNKIRSYQADLARAVAAERERCARVAEETSVGIGTPRDLAMFIRLRTHIAAAIRAADPTPEEPEMCRDCGGSGQTGLGFDQTCRRCNGSGAEPTLEEGE